MKKAIVIALILISFATDAFALSCGKRPTIEEAFKSADLVFAGEIIGIENHAYKFKIKEIFKDSEKNKDRKEVLVSDDWARRTGAEKVYKGNTFIMYTYIDSDRKNGQFL